MFIPIGDLPKPRDFVAWVTYGLIGVNVLVYFVVALPLQSQPVDPSDPLLIEYLRVIAPSLPSHVPLRAYLQQISAYDLVVFDYGYKPGAPAFGDLLASLFLHGGAAHLGGNMLFLAIYGRNVEHRVGRAAYLLAYLATGVAATLAFAAVAGDSLAPLIGASGAISGVLGLYFLMFPRNKVKVFVALFPIFFQVIRLPARWVLGFYVLLDNLLPFLTQSESSVAYGAHLGGFAAGLGLAYFGEQWAWTWPWRSRLGPVSAGAPPGLDGGAGDPLEIRAAIGAGDRQRALWLLAASGYGELAKLDPFECVILGRWLVEAGHRVAAVSLLRRCVMIHQGTRMPSMGRLHLELGTLLLAQGQPSAAAQHFLAVLEQSADAESEERARAALLAMGFHLH